ncbi:MAG: hypothetical protein N2657_05100 [bacterium]|nr:hypothetical protein [bacterium]
MIVKIFSGISRNILSIVIVFLIFSPHTLAGVLVPPKDLMYKHDPDYKSPDPEIQEESEKQKPPKIYYYKKDAFKEYYQNRTGYTKDNPNITNTYKPQTQYPHEESYTNIEENENKNKNKKQNYLLILLIILLILLGTGYIYLYTSNKLKEANTTPVYEKYSTKPLKRKKESIFDKVK